jgi:hypothetical protein
LTLSGTGENAKFLMLTAGGAPPVPVDATPGLAAVDTAAEFLPELLHAPRATTTKMGSMRLTTWRMARHTLETPVRCRGRRAPATVDLSPRKGDRQLHLDRDTVRPNRQPIWVAGSAPEPYERHATTT